MDDSDLTLNSVSTIREWIDAMPVIQTMGVGVRSAQEGFAELEMPYRDELSFAGDGRFAGAAVGALLDFCAGAAAVSTLPAGVFASTIDCQTKIVAPALAPALLARGQVLTPGRRILVVSVHVFGGGSAEELCAVGLVTAVRSKPASSEER